MKSNLSLGRTRATRFAFTLIELLVVVAIIVALLAILMPSLAKATATAEMAACLAHLRGAGHGVQAYAADAFGIFPGPNTSGLKLSQQDSAYSFKASSTEPTQNFDWVSPTVGDALGLPTNRNDRMIRIFNHDFRCPSNSQRYTDQYSSGTVPIGVTASQVDYSSYSSPTAFHLTKTNEGDGSIYTRSWIDSEVSVPTNVSPKLSAIGNASQKVWAMDGARYVYADGRITFNPYVKQIDGGNFMSWGPAMSDVVTEGNPYQGNASGPTDVGKRVAYRHVNDTMNAVFFDGHAANLDNAASRNVSFYFPRGSVVIDASSTSDPNDSNGQLIQ